MTRLGERSYMDNIKAGHDGKRKYYWIVRGKPDWKEVEDTDIWALGQKKISVTPLHSDLTTEIHFKQLQRTCSALFQDLKLSIKAKGYKPK